MVERAFRLLDIVGASEDGLTLSDLARALGMSKGSLHGLLKTLETVGAIELAEGRHYTLGSRVYDLAQAYVERAGLRRFALPAMRRLAHTLGQTILLGRVEHEGVRIIERVEAPSGPVAVRHMGDGTQPEQPALRISASRGTRVHLLAGATGRVILASWPEPQRVAYLRSHTLPRFTPSSLTDPDTYLAAVAEAARAGLGVDREEYLVGVNAVAAPIFGTDGALVALLWAIGFAASFAGDALDAAGEVLRCEAEDISRSLGAGSRSV
jgi:DNA-binding IclR family transcriptional regulator